MAPAARSMALAGCALALLGCPEEPHLPASELPAAPVVSETPASVASDGGARPPGVFPAGSLVFYALDRSDQRPRPGTRAIVLDAISPRSCWDLFRATPRLQVRTFVEMSENLRLVRRLERKWGREDMSRFNRWIVRHQPRYVGVRIEPPNVAGDGTARDP